VTNNVINAVNASLSDFIYMIRFKFLLVFEHKTL